jgi:hypothetical protein
MSSSFGPAIDRLLTPTRLYALGPGAPNLELKAELAALTLSTAFAGQRVRDEDAARCCLAGLWLLHDFLDDSHAISQEIETPSGSYWHGIMHRREPDYANSKYWFRRVGAHAVFPALSQEAKQLIQAAGAEDAIAKELLASNDWEPFRFVDWCEQIARGRSQQGTLAQQIAQAEWRLLFEHCYRQAIDD